MTSQHASTSSPHLNKTWDDFAQAQTLDVFCQSWLQLLVAQLPSCKAAAVLIENQQQFVPITVWPQVSPELARLAGVVEKCLQQHKSIIQPTSQDTLTEFAYPVIIEKKVVCLVVLEAAVSMAEAPAILRHIHWSSAWLSHIFHQKQQETNTHNHQQYSTLLEALSVGLKNTPLQQGLFDISNDLRQRLKAHKVAIALRHGKHMRLMALSEMASFEKNTPLAKAYVAAMEESMDLGKLTQQQRRDTTQETRVTAAPVSTEASAEEAEEQVTPDSPALLRTTHPTIELDTVHATDVSLTLPLHQQLLQLSQSGVVMSCPLVSGHQTVGVVLCERKEALPFSLQEQQWLSALSALLAPIIQQRQAAKRHSLSRLGGEIRALGQRLFGAGHLIWKTASLALVLTIVVLSVWHVDYRVSAKTVIEGEVQRMASAPFAGFIAHSYARAGDTVTKDQVLAQLDDRELQMELLRWASERDQYESKLREAIAQHKLSEVQIMTAQREQAQAQWNLVHDKIERARIKAPFTGMIVAGDLSQQIGAPVELGKELFTITPLTRYRVILQVDERDIRYIRAQQHGKLVIIGLAGEPIDFYIHHITAVASQAEGKNFFRVEALLNSHSLRLRPGMEGIGKISTEPRTLGWVLFHPLWDWISLSLWKWLP